LKPSSLHHVRRLTIALFLSGALNIGLITYVTYLRAAPPTYLPRKASMIAATSTTVAPTNIDKLRAFKKLSMAQLIGQLHQSQLLENGYTTRDLALGALVSLHAFDLSRALPGQILPSQRKVIVEGSEIVLTPGLSETQFAQLIRFAQTEKWPLTSEGLFNQLTSNDPTIIDAFLVTPEYRMLDTLLRRTNTTFDKGELLSMVQEGGWSLLMTSQTQDYTSTKRDRILVAYLKKGSTLAADLLIRTNGDPLAKSADDATIQQLLNQMHPQHAANERFARVIAESPRSDKIQQLAISKLQTPLVPLKKPAPIVNTLPKPQSLVQKKIYIVQEGDSLWKIARKVGSDTETLRTYNGLTSDALKPGIVLRIP